MSRRGFSLAELVVALVLLAVATAGATRVLLTEGRFYRELGQRAELADNLRAGSDILAADLWSLDAVDGDILAFGPDSVRIRAERAFAVTCAVAGVPGPGLTLTLPTRLSFGVRDFRAGDSLLVYVPGDSVWATGAVTSATSPARCPDSSSAEKLDGTIAGVPSSGAPVRAFEIVTYRSYRASDGSYYLGLRDAGGLQPLAGPLAPDGLRFAFYDSAGGPAAAPGAVQAIRIRLRALSAQVVVRRGRAAVLDDSVVVWVTLRNNRRRRATP